MDLNNRLLLFQLIINNQNIIHFSLLTIEVSIHKLCSFQSCHPKPCPQYWKYTNEWMNLIFILLLELPFNHKKWIGKGLFSKSITLDTIHTSSINCRLYLTFSSYIFFQEIIIYAQMTGCWMKGSVTSFQIFLKLGMRVSVIVQSSRHICPWFTIWKSWWGVKNRV